jgi:hypothetical protein
MGTVIGLAMGFGVEHLMNSMLFNAGGVDFVAYVIVVPSLFLVTLLAAYVPARRASRIAPTQAAALRVVQLVGERQIRRARLPKAHNALGASALGESPGLLVHPEPRRVRGSGAFRPAENAHHQRLPSQNSLFGSLDRRFRFLSERTPT